MHKGQIFSTDLLLAMIIIIFGLGTLLSVAEFNLYDTKEKLIQDSLKEKTAAAAIAITNSAWSSCVIDGTPIAYSINTFKLNDYISSPETLKQMLGISDYNTQITMSPSNKVIVLETLNSENIEAIDLNVLMCDSNATFRDLNSCMNNATCNDKNMSRQTLTIRVGR